jgi:L-arabonate dehydrase
VRDGDEIELDVAARKLNLRVSDQEMAERAKAFKSITGSYTGYAKFYADNVLQADKGVDFGFLVGRRGTPTLRNYL